MHASRLIALVLAAGCVVLATTSAAAPLRLEGTIVGPSPVASHTVWIATDLDLTAEDQPVASAAVDPTTGDWAVEVDTRGEPYWVFLHERYQPAGGPPIDHFLPHTLLPAPPDVQPEPIIIHAIDPTLLMSRARASFAPKVLLKLALIALGLLGLGFGVRFALRNHAAEGKNAAPLRDRGAAEPIVGRERRALILILVVAVALRLWGMFTDSLELLEVSYLPGIGRPSPFGGGSSGFGALPAMLWEMAQLYCLDLVHPPLYHFLMGVMGLFGTAAWLLRIPGLIVSIATLLLLHAVLRRRSPGAGLAAAAVFAVAAPAVYFGQDATPYAAVGLAAIAMIHSMLAALERGTEAAWRTFFLVLILGFLCHYNVAFVGLAGLGALISAAFLGREDPRWPAALRLATGPALRLAVIPLAWVWLHISTFDTVAQDTRLVADTYSKDPGALSFLGDFLAVTAGIRADGPRWALLGVLPLLALGIHRAMRPKERRPGHDGLPMGLLALGCTVVFVVSVFFFYDNVRTHLGGRVFYGFRWVSWYHPVLLGLCTFGAWRGAGPKVLRGSLAAIWFAGIAHGTVLQLTEPRRPDYAAAAEHILRHAEDRDAVASLPTWFQRGVLGHYFFARTEETRVPSEGEAVWSMEGKRITIEAVHPSLPFESTAINPHYDRLWVAVIEETMFGRDKFSAEVAAQAVAWADTRMTRLSETKFDGITLLLYDVPHEIYELEPGGTRWFRADRIVLNSRTYPRDAAGAGFTTPSVVEPAKVLDVSMVHQAPMTPGCVDGDYTYVHDALEPEARTHWMLELAVPVAEGAANPEVVRHSRAQIQARREGNLLRVTVWGGPCTGPPPLIQVRGI